MNSGLVQHKFNQYMDLLKTYGSTINLISKTQEISKENFHIKVSFELLHIIQQSSQLDIQLYDLGSGNGLPGIILGIAGYKVDLFEIDKRKSAFLEIAKAELKINCMIKSNYKLEGHFNGIITVKGLDSINNIIKELHNKLSSETSLYFLKGKNFQKELDLALNNWKFNYNIYKSKEYESVIIEINSIRQK